MLVGYAQHGFGREASEIYYIMHSMGSNLMVLLFLEYYLLVVVGVCDL